jgi:2-C-methyl-D-erythritol 2,4-cyclodiphosphate synthase
MNESVRIGTGYDIHRLVEGRKLVLGGVPIPFEKGLLGHSDSDVLTHAICDALLGAAALGDIGTHFPDSDPRWAGASSLEFLARVAELVTARGYRVANIDATVMAERPKLMPYVPAIGKKLASVLQLDVDQVNIKAKTSEGLESVGRGEAMAAQAVVLLISSSAGFAP